MRDGERNIKLDFTVVRCGSTHTDLCLFYKKHFSVPLIPIPLTTDTKPCNRLYSSITLPNKLDGSTILTIDFRPYHTSC